MSFSRFFGGKNGPKLTWMGFFAQLCWQKIIFLRTERLKFPLEVRNEQSKHFELRTWAPILPMLVRNFAVLGCSNAVFACFWREFVRKAAILASCGGSRLLYLLGVPCVWVAVGACVTVRDYFVAFYTPSYCRNDEFFNSFEKLLKIQ